MQLALKLIRPQGQRSELILFFIALVIAITSVSAVSLVADRLNQALNISSRDFIAADRVVSTSQPLPNSVLDAAHTQGLATSQTVGFTTMLFGNNKFQLASVRAVDAQYPLRGQLELSPQAQLTPGQIWLSPQLEALMGAKVGEQIEIGETQLTVAGRLVKEPDAGFSPMMLAPTALIHMDDVAKANVIQPGSRVSWRYLFAGDEATLVKYGEFIKPQLQPGEKWYGATQGDTPVAQPLERAARFFTLSALIGVLLGALAMGITLRHYAKAQLDTVALLKTLGASSRQIMTVFWSLLLIILVTGTTLGLAIGWGVQLMLVISLGELIPENLPLPSLMPLFLTIGMGLLLTLITAYAPLSKLLKTPPLRVLRKDLSVVGFKYSSYVMLLFGPIGLVWLISSDLLLSIVLLIGLLLVLVLVAAIGWLLLLLANQATKKGALHMALQRLRRHRMQSLTQLAGLSVSLLLMAFVVNIQDDLSHIWQQRLPDGAPNRFLINIADYDIKKLEHVFVTEDVESSDLVPVVQARISHVNGEPLQKWYGEAPPRRIARERTLTWLNELPQENTIISGQWWQAEGEEGISIEEEFAQELKVTLGDEITYSVGGQTITAPIKNIRTVVWESMQPNFMMILSPALLQDYPATYITSFYLPPASEIKESRIVKQFPSVSVINVEKLINQLDTVIEKVSKALTLMVSIVIAAAVLVMLAILQVSMKERQHELVLMRTLGAQASLMRNALQFELLATGLIAGVVAVVAVEASSWVLAKFWLEIDMRFHYITWLVLPCLGAFLSVLTGSLQVRPIVNNVLSHKIKAF